MLDNLLYVLTALLLVAINGYFVAVEFALIKTRVSRLEQMVAEERPFAKHTLWLMQRLDGSLAACQLGITMASLALGWVGEPAFARLVEPALAWLGVESQALLHGVGFAIAFTTITALHLVAGEQVPKIMAIRTAEKVALPLSPPLRAFYVMTYPLLAALSATTSFVLARFGIEAGSGHDEDHSEDEIRAMMRQARVRGVLSPTEDRLLHAVFEFDDMLCRRVMLPRREIVWVDADATRAQCLQLVQRTKHTRYPVCEGSLDRIVGVLHIKDLVASEGQTGSESQTASPGDVRGLMRPPQTVSESMPISRLLRHFQASHNHLAFVVDEHGTMTGLVTLDNVVEQIVGAVDDEFDNVEKTIVPQESGEFLLDGRVAIAKVNQRLNLDLKGVDVDTISGLLTEALERVPDVGDKVTLPGATAEVLEVAGARATKIRMQLTSASSEPDASSENSAH
ncbi:MAG: hemolysin family protein [Planctomycetota bacterium]